LGLGLAIVRHLTELHGGSVFAASDGDGKGATFTIRIPLATDHHALKSSSSERAKPLTSPQPLKGLRVLLVEDEKDARELLALTLRVSGANVDEVESVQEALTTLQSSRPDVLLSDIGLPFESGYDLIRQIRAMPSDLSQTPAVALTAFATEKDRELALSAGFQVHLAKPVEPAALVEAIEHAIIGRRQVNNP
jgi:CheY-like chemotaxis protein